MNRLRNPRVLGGWLTGLAALIVYTLTMAPDVAFWDVGEFITTAVQLGIPHPPGAPTFVLLGHLVSMLPLPMGVAAEINFISVLASAFAAVLLYLIILEMLLLWEEGDPDWGGYPVWMRVIAAMTGALAYAFSSSAWFNAVEAEVYGLSMTVTALCIYLALRHVRMVTEDSRKRGIYLLLLIGYVMGLGAGNHLLALLTIPSILILLWYLDRKSLTRMDLWVGAILLFVLGYSVYILLYIRSGLNPPIDMNNPENLHNFIQFLQRRQYGSQSMLVTMLHRNASWAWQFDYQFLRYFQSQFVVPFYAIAFAGALINLYRDKRTFYANAALWVIMGVGLVVYLNMPDPQPRDRDYIYVGAYFATAIWIGMGVAGLTAYLRDGIQRLQGTIDPRKAARFASIIVGAAGIGLVVWQTASFYHSHDRTGDYIPWDYAYNILQSCEQDAILFTNGDNDTYPLWYLQEIEGIRRDIRIVNLSLLNTSWYIKELRDKPPTTPMAAIVTNQFLDTQLSPMQVGQDTTLAVEGLDWHLRRNQILRVQDLMVYYIIQGNAGKYPIYFAITVPNENQSGLDGNTQLEGFSFRLVPDNVRVDTERTVHNLKEVFHYRGILDPRVHKDENAQNLLVNYSVVFVETYQALMAEGKSEEAADLIKWGSERVDFDRPVPQYFLATAEAVAGDTVSSATRLEKIISAEEGIQSPVYTQAFGLLIYEYAAMGEFERSAATVERWLAEHPSDEMARGWITDLRAGKMPDQLRDLGRRMLP